MNSADLKGKKAAVFGTGDSSWDEFCGAVDIIEQKVKEVNGQIIASGFKWDGDLSEQAAADIIEWGMKTHQGTKSEPLWSLNRTIMVMGRST